MTNKEVDRLQNVFQSMYEIVLVREDISGRKWNTLGEIDWLANLHNELFGVL